MRIVTGTTVRLITRLAMAIGTALDCPNSSPRMAGPMNGTAGAEAVSAASALVLVRTAKTTWDNRKTIPYRPTIATPTAISSGTLWLSSARGVPTVPTKSMSGSAYVSTIRFRIEASCRRKSLRQAATKPSRKVTTTGRREPRMASSMAEISA